MAETPKFSGVLENELTRSLAVTYSEQVASGADVVLGQTIGRYQIRRMLGRGGMGQVYLARDEVLGRSVAIKLVGRSIQTARFLHEARAIAKLNHPNIVQLYDYGEYERGIYLALEYVEGETLRERIDGERVGIDDALRHCHAIAEALCHAHAAEVCHCDLKPSNVMVGRDGRVRVVDFGIARVGRDAAGTIGGTPDWMAPEQWAAAPLTDRVDVWALAIVCAQLLSGRHPLGDDPERRREAARDPDRGRVQLDQLNLPIAVADLIARSLDFEPTLRPSAAEWRQVLASIIAGHDDRVTEVAPYPGLAAFDEQHARFYFGREREIDEFLERLRDASHLAIVAPSGAGKSSFLHAGVIPRMHGRERWKVIAFRPGSDPVGALARHLTAAMLESDRAAPDLDMKEQIQTLRAELLETPTLLAARLATLAAAYGGRVLVAVDQLEEVFTQAGSDLERTQFLRMLLAAADDPADPVRVVFTVRDDFFSRIVGLRSLFVIQKLGIDDLRRTIVAPLARCGYDFDEAAIVDDLISEVGSTQVADLPLLQFACRTLWDGRDVGKRQLRRATYKEMGGLAGALARHAEQALAAQFPQERRTSRRLLLQLVSGTTRRSVARDQLIATGGPDAGAVLDRLVSARLLIQHNQGDEERATVEIAHESLLQAWAQLARWIDESREERRLLEELHDAASLWERRGKREDETWSPADLALARGRAAQLDLAVPAHVEAFLGAGEQRHRARRLRRRIRYGIVIAALGVIAVPILVLIARYLAREQLIRTNAGTVDFVFLPFDWINGAPRPVAIDQLPDLGWQLYATRPGDPREPGDPIPSDLVRIAAISRDGTTRTDRVTAPGGTVFLAISGRGRDERCGPSWLRIQAFPGYAGDHGRPEVRIEVPTCQATRADTKVVDAGEFMYGGPGEPPSRFYGSPDYTEPEQKIDLPRFIMDRTETSNAAYAPFARMARITGYEPPIYGADAVAVHQHEPGYPVTDIDAFGAEAFCRYMGKRLPGDFQWVKAVRGGLSINGKPNPMPRRPYPWGGNFELACANLSGPQDGFERLAPADSFACGASPYGVLNLAGNVQEWLSRDGQIDRDNPQYALRGGGVDSPPELEHATVLFRNHRDPRLLFYTVGFRCVSTE